PAREIRRLRADVILQNGLSRASDDLEGVLCGIPTAFFAHAYGGMCISGNRRFSPPTLDLCRRAFGPGCCLCYFGRGWGGNNPLTAVELYRENTIRLEAMRKAAAVLVASEYVRTLVVAHGVEGPRVKKVPLFISPPQDVVSVEDRYQSRELLYLG